MMTQSQLDCQALFLEKYGLDPKSSDFIHMWDLHYKHEENRPFEEELRTRIKNLLPNENHQEVYDTILVYFEDAKRRRRFFQRSNPEGYGYEVIDRNEGKWRLKFHTYDRQKSIDYCDALKLDENAIAPDTSEEIPPSRVLFINDHHGPIYFKADTAKEYKEKAVEYILNYIQAHPPQEYTDKNYLGFTEDEINAMPDGKIKSLAVDELKRFKNIEKESRAHRIAYLAFKLIKENGINSSFSDIEEVLNFYQGERCEGNWGIIDLK